MKTQTITALKILLIMTVLTGIIYPLCMTGLAQLIFPYRANGSLLKRDGKIIGSELIGQKSDSIKYFWSRPSAIDYNPVPSGASNFGPTSAQLKKQVVQRRKVFAEKNLVPDTTAIPKEMIFASASGLDPHISPEAALLQVERIARARNFDISQKQKLIKCINELTEYPQFFCLGEKRINVLMLNLTLDNF
ncbi:MAG: potassium-transporting ATPase subunit KdpC [Bacteroidia bacterium]|nr:potassium-transporting ATPase subunit KdpC [Bacteroidia bacterium]